MLRASHHCEPALTQVFGACVSDAVRRLNVVLVLSQSGALIVFNIGRIGDGEGWASGFRA